MPLPIDAKRALRPMRSPSAAWPTRPRLIAATAGPSTQLAAACRARAATTMKKIGQSAMASALTQIATTATPAAKRAERTASTSAPPGICPISADQAAGRQHQADVDLRPGMRRQIDRDERAEAGLDVGQEEAEPVQRRASSPRDGAARSPAAG